MKKTIIITCIALALLWAGIIIYSNTTIKQDTNYQFLICQNPQGFNCGDLELVKDKCHYAYEWYKAKNCTGENNE